LKLSATESNLIGLSANLGMYTMGVPIGMFVDNRGPRPAVLLGAILLAVGYYPFHHTYDVGAGSLPLLCFFSYLSGFGGCMAFAASVKVSALNWPHHRGTATAFPLAAFGLSAFFFSLLGSVFFPGDPSDFLLLLSCGTSLMTLSGFFFLKIYPQTSYQSVPTSDRDARPESRISRLSMESSNEPGMSDDPNYVNPSTPSPSSSTLPSAAPPSQPSLDPVTTDPELAVPPDTYHPTSETLAASDFFGQVDSDETTSLVSGHANDAPEPAARSSVDLDRSHRVDIRGWKLLQTVSFWQLFCMMAILAGVGLMTIK
jgi:hypothetical protein